MGKGSKADQKPPGEKQSRKRLRQWVSHWARLNRSLWTELFRGSEWRPHAQCGAKNKKKMKIRYIVNGFPQFLPLLLVE